MASDSRHDLRTTSSRLTNGASQSNDSPLLANDGTSGSAAGAPTAPLRATLADLFGEPQPDDPEWVARQQAHLAHVKALADELPDPDIPWQPGDHARLVWDRDERHWLTWLSDPDTGEFLIDASGARVPGHGLSHVAVVGGRQVITDAGDAASESGVAPPAATSGDAGDILLDAGVRRLDDISTSPPPPLLVNRIDPEGHTILFGTGGTGKGTLAAEWIVELVADSHIVLIIDYEAHPTEWARRIASLGGPETLASVYYVSPSTIEWHGPRGAIWAQTGWLREIADSVLATVAFVDSIVPACGATDALKSEAPGQYAMAIAGLGRPVVSLAHATKVEDLRYPFGSVFWHNLARRTYSLGKAPGARGAHAVVLSNRKSNNYARQPKVIVTVTWWNDLPREIKEQSYVAGIAEHVEEILADQPARTSAQIVDLLNDELEEGEARVKPNSVTQALKRGLKTDAKHRFVVDETAGQPRWSNA